MGGIVDRVGLTLSVFHMEPWFKELIEVLWDTWDQNGIFL